MTRRPSAPRGRQRGAGIVETMVGILIGLLVVVVVYNLLAVAEGYRRTTSGVSDAQITGLMAHFIVGQGAGNGGSGMTSAFSDLVNCTKNEAGAASTKDNTLKPISVLITPGATALDSDSFVARQSNSPHVTWSVPMRPVGGPAGATTVPPGGDIQVQSPTGFMTPGKASLPAAGKEFWAVAIANDASGKCGLINIADASPDPNMDATGEVLLKQGTHKTTIDYKGVPQNDTGTGAYLLNLGSANSVARMRYEVNPPGKTATETDQLLITDCSPIAGCAGVARNPIAQNVVFMKVQYGIDTTINADGSLDGTVDCWTPADNTACPVVDVASGTNMTDWGPDNLITAGETAAVPASILNRVLAVRIGIVVRSDEPDFKDTALVAATRQPMFLFNCTANTNLGCPNRVPVPAGAPSAVGKLDCRAVSNAILCDGWRYRAYEVIIPLRNNIFSATLPP